MDIFFWQNIISIHQSSFLIELSKLTNVKVTLVVENDISEDRLGDGWSIPDLEGVDVVISPNKNECRSIVGKSSNNAVHTFSGIRSSSFIRNAFLMSVKFNKKICILSESVNKDNGIFGYINKVLYLYDRIRFGKYILRIFAIGGKSYDWYKSVGYDENIIIPFGYFVKVVLPESRNISRSDKFNLLFVGRLIKLKGLHRVISELNKIDKKKYIFNIVGGGDEIENLVKMKNSLGLEENIIFHGVVNNDSIAEFITRNDLLILPSCENDGWGVVINEALLSGTQVLCSTYCGSSSILEMCDYGETYDPDKSNLSERLEHIIENGTLGTYKRNQIIDWANNKIGCGAASKYFYDSLHSIKKISPPWLV